MQIMNDIEYGFKDQNNHNIKDTNPKKWDKEFNNFYYLQTPNELLKSKCGVCWDQVELERQLFQDNNIQCETYFIYTIDNNDLPSHTFLTYKHNHKYYWFEHSWGIHQGIHEYENKLSLLLDVKTKFKQEHNYLSPNSFIYIYEYQKPKYHITCEEFYQYIETQKLIKTNQPLYFYHLVDKSANLSPGLLSLQYMYDHQMNDLFTKNTSKYQNRITSTWNIKKYQGKNTLTNEEYLDALNIFRGQYGSNYIYFFRYPPFKTLGQKIQELAKYKNIYRINLNDEKLQKHTVDIFYGYDMSNSDNKLLDKSYYENISKQDYFAKYDDTLPMNFQTLNHIGIAFKDGYCPLEFLEEVDWE